MGSYSDIYKRKMDSVFEKTESPKVEEKKENKDWIKEEKEEISEGKKIIYEPAYRKGNGKYNYLWFVVLGLAIVLAILVFFVQKTSTTYFIIIIGLVALFLVLFLLYRHYERAIHRSNPRIILWLMYLILVVDIILGTRYYSIEWAFLGFLAAAFVFYDARIDSRFLIFPALLLLGYVPFLLIGKQNPLAETIAVYIYYFLVVGVGLQVAQYIQKSENSLDFADSFMRTIKKINWIYVLVIFGILNLVVIVMNRFYDLEIWKWTLVFVFAVCFVMYIIESVSGKRVY